MLRRARVPLAALVLVPLAALAVRVAWREGPSPTPALPAGVTAEEHRRAGERFALAAGRRADAGDTLMQLAQQAVEQGRLTTALACLAEIPEDHPRHGRLARYQAGVLACQLYRYETAERAFRDFLRLEEQGAQFGPALARDARLWLSDLLLIELRFEERQELLRQMIARGEANVFGILDYCFPSLVRWRNPAAAGLVQECLKHECGGGHLQVAWGRHLTAIGRYDEAETVLRECRRRRPESLRAQAALLECLYERGDWAQFELLVQELPPARPSDPWLLTKLRAEFYFCRNNLDEAARHFEQVLKTNPTDPQCHGRLSRCYAQTPARGGARRVSPKPALIGRIQSRLAWMQREPENPQPLLEIIEMCLDGGFSEQAQALFFALRSHPQREDFEAEYQRLRRRLAPSARKRGG